MQAAHYDQYLLLGGAIIITGAEVEVRGCSVKKKSLYGGDWIWMEGSDLSPISYVTYTSFIFYLFILTLKLVWRVPVLAFSCRRERSGILNSK